jgi:hypothetical protein
MTGCGEPACPLLSQADSPDRRCDGGSRIGARARPHGDNALSQIVNARHRLPARKGGSRPPATMAATAERLVNAVPAIGPRVNGRLPSASPH